VVDIFDEVDEELRADRAQQLLKRYGGHLIALAVLVVVGVGGWQGWRWWEHRRDLAAAEGFLTAMRAAEALPADAPAAARLERAGSFEQLAATAPDGYRSLARLRAAALRAEGGDLPGALAQWEAVAADGSADAILRDHAALAWVRHQIDTGDPAALRARLAPLAGPGRPFRALALEASALLDMRLGNTDAARETLRTLAADTTAPDGVRGRANGLLTRLGG